MNEVMIKRETERKKETYRSFLFAEHHEHQQRKTYLYQYFNINTYGHERKRQISKCMDINIRNEDLNIIL